MQPKRTIRKLVAQRPPAQIARRPKQGFEVPIDRWLREDLAEMTGDLLGNGRLESRGILSGAVVRDLLAEHRSGERSHGLRLYALLVLELWMSEVIDRSRAQLVSV